MAVMASATATATATTKAGAMEVAITREMARVVVRTEVKAQ